MLHRLGATPVAVFAADWRLVWWNESWAAVLGDPSAVPIAERSLVRVRFPVAGDGGCVAHWPVVPEDRDASDRAVVADLRRAAGRYPSDERLTALIEGRLRGNSRFAELWQDAVVGGHREDRKTIRHPHAGDITVDCDVLHDSDTDLKVVVYTAEPGSESESKLQFVRVIGAPAPPSDVGAPLDGLRFSRTPATPRPRSG